jgi:hypothetical protein
MSSRLDNGLVVGRTKQRRVVNSPVASAPECRHDGGAEVVATTGGLLDDSETRSSPEESNLGRQEERRCSTWWPSREV